MLDIQLDFRGLAHREYTIGLIVYHVKIVLAYLYIIYSYYYCPGNRQNFINFYKMD